MKIYSLLTYVEHLKEAGFLVESYISDKAAAVESITYNSKECRCRTLFACKGAHFTAKYLDEAVALGACCYLSEKKYETAEDVSYIIVSSVRKAMALIADIFYDSPYSKLKMIGITGTKGKSTTAYFLKYIIDEYLQSLGEKPCGLLSTLTMYDGTETEEAHLTTPEAFELHRRLDNGVNAGLKYFVMEVSSQALKYDRVLGIDFCYGIFLNIGEDHISPIEHSDFEDYFSSKLKLFSQCRAAVVNLDCDYSQRVVEAARASERLYTFSLKNPNADLFCSSVKKVKDGISFIANGEEYTIAVSGFFNVENALAAIALAKSENISYSIIKSGLYKMFIPGRMETIKYPERNITVIVDYAHNKLSFEKLFQSVEKEYSGQKIIALFGCPGNKAYNRRSELGAVAAQYADRIILTADDPCEENPDDISREVAKHIDRCCYEIISDRAAAISHAIETAEDNTVIIIAGKGHENCQKTANGLEIIGSDRENAEKAIARLEYIGK